MWVVQLSAVSVTDSSWGATPEEWPVVVKLAPAAEIKQSWWEWRWDESKNSRAFRGSGFHALSCIHVYLYVKPCGSSQAPPSGTKLSSPPVFEHYIIISPTADSFLLIHLHFTFIRSISVLIFLLLFCLIHPPAVWTTLPTIASSSALLLSPSSSTFLLFHPTTLTSLPGIRVQRSYSGHQWKHVTATIWPPPLLFLLWFVHFPSLFIFWLCFIYSCIYRSFFSVSKPCFQLFYDHL